MLKYQLYHPTRQLEAITSEKFIPGTEIVDIMEGNYANVTHIEKYRNMIKPHQQILVKEYNPDDNDEVDNELFPDLKGMVIIIEGLCDV